MIRFLLLHRIEWTDANPSFGIVGALVTIILAGIFDQVTK